MAIIVEDGSIVSGAESYVSVADADTYHSNLGNTAWEDLSATEKESALRKATSYMLGKYGEKWLGYKMSSSQELDWPRQYVPISDLVAIEYVSNTIVPDEVKNACASLALRSNTADLLADQERIVIREKVDVIETEYSEHSPQSKSYPEIDNMLKKFLANTSGALEMVRV